MLSTDSANSLHRKARAPDNSDCFSLLPDVGLQKYLFTRGSHGAFHVRVTGEQFSGLIRIPGLDLDTLWRLEVLYLGDNGEVLSTTRLEVVYVLGEWRSELAPMQISPGYVGFRDPGELGDGPPDLASALRLAPSSLTMRMSQRIVRINERQPILAPARAAALHARVLEVCPLKVRRIANSTGVRKAMSSRR